MALLVDHHRSSTPREACFTSRTRSCSDSDDPVKSLRTSWTEFCGNQSARADPPPPGRRLRASNALPARHVDELESECQLPALAPPLPAREKLRADNFRAKPLNCSVLGLRVIPVGKVVNQRKSERRAWSRRPSFRALPLPSLLLYDTSSSSIS